MKLRTRIHYSNAQNGCQEGRDVGAMEARLDAPSDCPTLQSSTYVGPGNPVPDRRHSATDSSSVRDGTEAGRERGDLPRRG